MLRDVAVQRINDGLGFRPAGNPLESKIILRLQEAQRDLESGKTLPRFLLQEDQPLSLLSGTSTVALPDGFIRESDETRIRFTPSDTDVPVFLARRYFIDAVQALLTDEEEESTFPRVYVIRNTVIDFISVADQTYSLLWDYYKRAAVLLTNIENAWLASLDGGAEWLIGEAGRRIAVDLENVGAVERFTELRKMGRAACFGETVAAELASGPLEMGANL